MGAGSKYDFSTMYTSMQLKDIEQKMHAYVDLVLEYKRQSSRGRSYSECALKLQRKGRT